MTALRVLCLFTSPRLRDESFFAGRDGHWVTEADQGCCELVPLVIDDDVVTLAKSGLFAAAILLCRFTDLGPGIIPTLRSGVRAFAQAEMPLDVIASDRPVGVLAWLSEQVPELVAHCRIDGEGEPELPSWWRDRVQRLFARVAAPVVVAAAEDDLAEQVRAYVRGRGW